MPAVTPTAAPVSSSSSSPAAPPAPTPSRERLLSLDAFRGFDIAAMLLVNMTWNTSVFHPQLFHIDWNAPAQGATFTDLVFPWFLFIMGCAIPLSMRSGRGRAMPAWKKVAIAARRGIVLYLFGVLLTFAGTWDDSPMHWTHLFSWNILQLIGVGYFVAACVWLMPWWGRVGFVVLVLAGKWLLMCGLDAEGLRSALANAGMSPRAAGEAAPGPGTFTHFDDGKRVLHAEHLKAAAAAAGSPQLPAYLLGWLGMAQQFLPCAAIAITGGFCTQILAGDGVAEPWSKFRRGAVLIIGGLGVVAVSYALQAAYRPEGGGLLGAWTVPFSKWFFSPAYCLLSAGTGAVLLGLFYLWIDCGRITSGLFWRVMGLNALALYLAAELSFKIIWSVWKIRAPLPGERGRGALNDDGTLRLAPDSIMGGTMKWFDHWLGGWRTTEAFGTAWTWSPGLTLHVVLYLGLWWLFCLWLHRRRWYWKV